VVDQDGGRLDRHGGGNPEGAVLLPAVQSAPSAEQMQTVAEKFETGLAKADQAKQNEAEERRMAMLREREQVELEAQQAEATQRERDRAERRARRNRSGLQIRSACPRIATACRRLTG
jgi:hypothetical protein